jgi:hypothetical protein
MVMATEKEAHAVVDQGKVLEVQATATAEQARWVADQARASNEQLELIRRSLLT